MAKKDPRQVLEFWRDAGPKAWFEKNEEFDAAIRERFGETHERAAAGELDGWQASPDGSLALILVLDQFSRNLFRNDPRAFAQDEKCLAIVDSALESGADRKMPEDLRMFAYMPLMHSERIADQDRCIREMLRIEAHENVKFAVLHRDIIARFGRFPHRNAVLGRHTTPAEQAYLEDGGFKG